MSFAKLALFCTVALVLNLRMTVLADCIAQSQCVRTPAQVGKPCPDPAVVTVPTNVTYAPAPMATPSLLETPCPFLDGSQPVCCDDDSATIMGKS